MLSWLDSLAVHVEWCKAWAHSHRWTEDVSLLLEEMRRVVTSYEHKAAWWREHRHGLGCIWPSVDHAEGAHAYVSEHAAVYKDLISHCRLVWARECKPVITKVAATIPEASDVLPDDNDSVDSDSSEDVVEDADGFIP